MARTIALACSSLNRLECFGCWSCRNVQYGSNLLHMWHISQKSEEIPSFELHENALLFSMQVHNSNHGRVVLRYVLVKEERGNGMPAIAWGETRVSQPGPNGETRVRSGDSWAVKDGSTLMRSGSGTEFELTKWWPVWSPNDLFQKRCGAFYTEFSGISLSQDPWNPCTGITSLSRPCLKLEIQNARMPLQLGRWTVGSSKVRQNGFRGARRDVWNTGIYQSIMDTPS